MLLFIFINLLRVILNQLSESHSLFKGVNITLFTIFKFIIHSGWNSVQKVMKLVTLNNCEFYENQPRKGRTFIMSIHETVLCAVKLADTSIRKNALLQPMYIYSNTECTICTLLIDV